VALPITAIILRYFHLQESLSAKSPTGGQLERARDGTGGGPPSVDPGRCDARQVELADRGRPMRRLTSLQLQILYLRYWARPHIDMGDFTGYSGHGSYTTTAIMAQPYGYDEIAELCGLASARAARRAIEGARRVISRTIDEDFFKGVADL